MLRKSQKLVDNAAEDAVKDDRMCWHRTVGQHAVRGTSLTPHPRIKNVNLRAPGQKCTKRSCRLDDAHAGLSERPSQARESPRLVLNCHGFDQGMEFLPGVALVLIGRVDEDTSE